MSILLNSEQEIGRELIELPFFLNLGQSWKSSFKFDGPILPSTTVANIPTLTAITFPYNHMKFESSVGQGAKYLGFFSSRSLKTREKCIIFTKLVLLSLYTFRGKCVYFSIFQ